MERPDIWLGEGAGEVILGVTSEAGDGPVGVTVVVVVVPGAIDPVVDMVVVLSSGEG